MKLNKYQALLISIIIPSLIAFLGVQSSYWFGFRSNLGLVEFVYSFLAICVGAYAFSKIRIVSKPKLIIAWLIYLLGLAAIIFWVSLITACNNGDCL